MTWARRLEPGCCYRPSGHLHILLAEKRRLRSGVSRCLGAIVVTAVLSPPVVAGPRSDHPARRPFFFKQWGGNKKRVSSNACG